MNPPQTSKQIDTEIASITKRLQSRWSKERVAALDDLARLGTAGKPLWPVAIRHLADWNGKVRDATVRTFVLLKAYPCIQWAAYNVPRVSGGVDKIFRKLIEQCSLREIGDLLTKVPMESSHLFEFAVEAVKASNGELFAFLEDEASRMVLSSPNFGLHPSGVPMPHLNIPFCSKVARLCICKLSKQLPRLRSELIKRLQSPQEWVRASALLVLREDKDYGASLIATHGLRDPDSRVADIAKVQLSEVGFPALPEMLLCLRSEVKELQRAGLFVLDLQASTNDEKKKWDVIYTALPEVVAFLANPDPEIRSSAASVIAHCDLPQPVGFLRSVMAALRRWKNIKRCSPLRNIQARAERIYPLALNALNNNDPLVRLAGACLIEMIRPRLGAEQRANSKVALMMTATSEDELAVRERVSEAIRAFGFFRVQAA